MLKLLDRFKQSPKRKGKVVSLRSPEKRSFAGAELDRLTAAFKGTTLSANEELIRALPTLRARSRQLANDNDYGRRFLQMVKANVVGPNGIALQARPRRTDGTIDRPDANTIEKAWAEWGKPANCSMNGRLGWREIQRLVMETVARDGECLVQMVKTDRSKYGMALHIIEADYLDETLNQAESNNQPAIKMGIEVDGYDRPVAYYLRTSHPGDGKILFNGKPYIRVVAEEIIHLYITERPGQSRGLPWMHTAIRRLNMLGGYEEAELVAARTAASKMGFFTSPDGDGMPGDDVDAYGSLISEAEPGVFEQLPAGVDFQSFDPTHPTSAFPEFVRATLRGAAAGLGVSYHTLSNDLENVNYSSIRSGVLEEREQWKVLQSWLSEQFCEPVYNAWLTMALDFQKVPLPKKQIDKFREVVWMPRGFAWVDPLKDAQANAQAIEMGVLTRAEVAAATGRDLDEILEQLATEKARLEELGLTAAEKEQTNDE